MRPKTDEFSTAPLPIQTWSIPRQNKNANLDCVLITHVGFDFLWTILHSRLVTLQLISVSSLAASDLGNQWAVSGLQLHCAHVPQQKSHGREQPPLKVS